MNITSNSSLLTSLTSLLDSNGRAQQQTLQDRQHLRQQQQKKAVEQTSKTAENTDRQNRIDANRNALRELQARLKADNLAKLQNDPTARNAGSGGNGTGRNLNLRENLGNSNKPADSRPGQIIDIRV